MITSRYDVRWLAAEGLIAIGKKAGVLLLTALTEELKSLWLRENAALTTCFMIMDRGDWDGFNPGRH